MSITPLSFTGVSSYSNDFQTILSRAVSIASLPLKSLQNQDSDLLQQTTQLATLTGAVSRLGSSLATLAGFGDSKALSATSSDPSTVSVTNTAADTAIAYTINEITSLASTASETSLIGYADSQSTPVSSTGTVKLTVGGNTYTIDLSGKNTLAGLRDSINSLGAGVTASILTAGSSNYLHVAATTLGSTTLTLTDDPTGANTDLLTATNQGSNAVFKLNGIPITRTTNTVNDLIPGLAFSLRAKTTSDITLSLNTDRSQISAALSDLAASFNNANQAVGQQVGPAAGLLSGDFLVRQIQQHVREVSAYSGSGAVKSLGDLGITFDAGGKASFDSTVFDQLPDSTISSALTFFGSAQTGLGAIAKSLDQITDPLTGLAKLQQDSYTKTDLRLRTQIDTLTDQINQMQASLTLKLQTADALLAQLQSQQNVIAAGIQSMNLVTFGKNANSN
ncbi:MAG: flagellar filament capping protein FliD [Bryobacteraceae bacterium]